MNKLYLLPFFSFLSFNLFAQELYPTKRATIALETMIQSQINIGGLKNSSTNSDKGNIRSQSFGISPLFGLLFTLRTNQNSSLTTGLKLGQYKTATLFSFDEINASQTYSIILKRIILGIPLVYNKSITKKCMVGVGAEFFFDVPDEMKFSSAVNNNSSTTFTSNYNYAFGNNYKSIGFIVQGNYSLTKRICFKLSCNIDTQQKKAFSANYVIDYNNTIYKWQYSYNPYSTRYSAGIEIKLLGCIKQ